MSATGFCGAPSLLNHSIKVSADKQTNKQSKNNLQRQVSKQDLAVNVLQTDELIIVSATQQEGVHHTKANTHSTQYIVKMKCILSERWWQTGCDSKDVLD